MKFFDVVFSILLIVGGLNWGLVGIANYDLVATVCGAGTPLAKLVYILVGVSALYKLFFWKAIHSRWCGR